MKIKDCDFRELERNWIIIDKYSDIKKLSKLFKYEFIDAPILAYCFIDHNKGLSLRIVGNVFLETNRTLSLNDDLIVDEKYIISDAEIYKYKIEIIEKEIVNKIDGTNDIENEINNYYYKNSSIIDARQNELFDEFRKEILPDDFEVCLITNKKTELLWVRTEVWSKEKNIIGGKLLETSKNDPKYVEGSYVLIKIIQQKKKIELIIDTIVEIKSNN